MPSAIQTRQQLHPRDSNKPPGKAGVGHSDAVRQHGEFPHHQTHYYPVEVALNRQRDPGHIV